MNELDVFVAYGYTWRNSNESALKKLSQKESANIRVFLPDIENSLVVASLANRFDISKDKARERLETAKKEFGCVFGQGDAEFELVEHSFTPHYTFYRMDDEAIICTYNYRGAKGEIIAVKVGEGGRYFEYLHKELAYLEDKGSTAH